MKTQCSVVVMVGLLLSSSGVQAGLIEVKLTPVANAFVDSSEATQNFGDDDVLRVQGYADDGISSLNAIQRSYLKFALPNDIPAGSIQTAVFGIHLKGIYPGEFGFNDEDPWIDLHYVADDGWTQNALVWDNRPDFEPDAIGEFHNTVDAQYYYWDLLSGPGFTWTDFDADLADGYLSLMLKMIPSLESSSNAWAEFYGLDSPETFVPYLKVSYIPEPATLALLGIGGLLVRGRKRKTAV